MAPAPASISARFAAIAGVSHDAPIDVYVRAIHALPYGRADGRTAEAVLSSGRGTCSTKHYLLAEVLRERCDGVRVDVVHRVYTLDREGAARLFGAAAGAVPAEGITDVHTYLVTDFGDGPITLDVTFPGTPEWDGHASMPIQCGDGRDVEAGADPEAVKAGLVAEHCDPAVRERFIASLSAPDGDATAD